MLVHNCDMEKRFVGATTGKGFDGRIQTYEGFDLQM